MAVFYEGSETPVSTNNIDFGGRGVLVPVLLLLSWMAVFSEEPGTSTALDRRRGISTRASARDKSPPQFLQTKSKPIRERSDIRSTLPKRSPFCGAGFSNVHSRTL